MYKNKYSALVRFAAMVLLIALVLPVGSNAAVTETVQPRASSYLGNYSAYVYPAGSGLVQVWFDVTGTGRLDTIGSLRIVIYESVDNSTWTWKKTYTHDVYTDMLDYNDFYHSGHVDYQGFPGRYYKAYVCIWGGKDGGGDTRYYYTSAKKAT